LTLTHKEPKDLRDNWGFVRVFRIVTKIFRFLLSQGQSLHIESKSQLYCFSYKH